MAQQFKKIVLSIDGGGIRGIIPAIVLNYIEERTGKWISDMFDLIAGTSTGGILALGLTKRNVDFSINHELAQVVAVSVYRDRNKDGFRRGDAIDIGLFGINQHWGYDIAVVDNASAGCLVGQSQSSHTDFMTLVKQDRRYQLNNQYRFMTTIIAGDDLAAMV
jgi:Patatin-like phospholipase